MDIDRIPFGTDFRHHIQDALRGADILLAVIGPTWLGKTADGRTRIQDEADPVRVEIEAALKQGLAVIPVLVDNATMPGAADLPESIRDFAYINAAPIDVGRDFRAHMERLTRSIDGIVGTDKAAMEVVLARGYPDAPKASSVERAPDGGGDRLDRGRARRRDHCDQPDVRTGRAEAAGRRRTANAAVSPSASAGPRPHQPPRPWRRPAPATSPTTPGAGPQSRRW